MRWTLSRKIVAGNVAAFGAACVFGIPVFLWGLLELDAGIRTVMDERVPELEACRQMERATLAMRLDVERRSRPALAGVRGAPDAAADTAFDAAFGSAVDAFDACAAALLSGGALADQTALTATGDRELRGLVASARALHAECFVPKGRALYALASELARQGVANAESSPYYAFALREFDEAADETLAAVALAVARSRTATAAARARSEGVLGSVLGVIGGLVVAIGAGAIALGWLLARSIARPVAAMAEASHRMAAGDLTRRVEIANTDETGDLARAFNTVAANLGTVVGGILKNSDQFREASVSVAFTAKQLAVGATQQQRGVQQISERVAGVSEQMEKLSAQIDEMAAGLVQASAAVERQVESVERVSSTMEEMSASAQAVGENASRARAQGETAVTSAFSGRDAVQAASRGMVEITATIDELAGTISSLGTRSSQIGEIVDTIAGVASQTNLLALNAAIEAARAGVHGRGFAVVADEVRKLAERTAEAAEQIESLVKTIRDEVDRAVRATETGIGRVKRGTELTGNVGSALQQIILSIEETSEAIRGILASAEEQTRGAREVVEAIGQLSTMSNQIAAGMAEQSKGSSEIAGVVSRTTKAMDETAAAVKEISGVASQSASGARQMASSADDLATRSAELRSLMEQFDVGGDGAPAASARAGGAGHP